MAAAPTGRSWPEHHTDAFLDVLAELKGILDLYGESDAAWEQASGLLRARGLEYTPQRCQLKFHQLRKTFMQRLGPRGEPDRTLKFCLKMEAVFNHVQPLPVQFPDAEGDAAADDAEGRQIALEKRLGEAVALRQNFQLKLNQLDQEIAALTELLHGGSGASSRACA